MQRSRHRIGKDSGFTLIEVLIALAIFSIGFMAVGALQTGALMRTGEIARKTEAWTVLEDQVEVLKAMPFYANDNGDDDDSDGDTDEIDETDPLLQDTQAFPDFEHNENRLNGRYQVHWRVENDEPIGQVTVPPPSAGDPVLTGVPNGTYTVSKTITVAVTKPGGDPATESLAKVEFVKTWAADKIE
ncbi:MAG: prepilin-type N-terminal cleavage/methylation domain-containing protein [Desulfosalsimonadaceae bacterium]